jgi:hypothetical protein
MIEDVARKTVVVVTLRSEFAQLNITFVLLAVPDAFVTSFVDWLSIVMMLDVVFVPAWFKPLLSVQPVMVEVTI